MAKRVSLVAGLCSALVLVALVSVSDATGSLASAGVLGARVTSSPVSGFYLAIGASSSLGVQPTGIPAHNGHRTNSGYANDVVAFGASRGVTLTLRQVGCPGETARSMLQAKDACYEPPDGQLHTAINFLGNNSEEDGLVTIDIGFNDVRKCMLNDAMNVTCANQGLNDVRNNLPIVLQRLQGAAGPHVHFIGLLYADPFTSDYLLGPSGITPAVFSLHVIGELNAALTKAYGTANIAMANVPGAFKIQNGDRVPLNNVGIVPENVAYTCDFTWMCAAPPWGPDDHPNNAGYRLIANAIVANFPASW